MKKTVNPYLRQELTYFLHTFNRQPIWINKAKGPFVWDHKGKRYLDFFSGLAVCGVGHNNDQVVRAIQKQTNAFLHVSNYFYTAPQMELAKALTHRWPNSRVFFSNSGAEANELAIKLARLWAGHHRKRGRETITFQNSFHGRTLATTAASSWGRKANRLFSPLPTGFKSIPFNRLDIFKKSISMKTIAVLVEPIQGEGGIHIATPSFLKGIARICKRENLLLIADEIQSGMGRTGTFFAFESYGIEPDIVTLAKGLGGGLPLGATLTRPHIGQYVKPGLHGSTFGGNPVACASALEVLKLLTPRALRLIRRSGEDLYQKLTALRRYRQVRLIRSRGLMIGIELTTDGSPYVSLAREKGLLINCTQEKVLRFLPPYFISPKEMEKAVSILTTVFETLNKI